VKRYVPCAAASALTAADRRLSVSLLMMLAAAVAFLGGFVALVARLGDRPDDDDDGAVV